MMLDINSPLSTLKLSCDKALGSSIRFEFTSVKLLDYHAQWAAPDQSRNPFALVVMAHLKTQETRQELKTYEEARQMTYITSVEQIGYDRGRKEGRKETEQQLLERQRSLILKQLARKVGTVPQEVGDRVQQLSLRQLESLGEALFDVETLQDATKWLNKRPRKRKIASSEPSNL
jgi:hypothetical protein